MGTSKRKKTKRQLAASILGRAGGARRAKVLSPERRKEIARQAGFARQRQRRAAAASD